MIKQLQFKSLLLMLCILLGGVNVWADTYTLGWGTASGDEGTYTNFTANSGSVSGIVSFSSAKNSSSNAPAYNATSKELRLYYNSGGDGGSIILEPASDITITGFVMTTSTSPSVKYSVDGGSATSVSASSNTYTVTGISASSSLTIQNVNTSNTQLRIKTIQITYTAATGVSAPTFTPVEGTYYGTQSVTISSTTSGVSIYYTDDGTTPSSTNGTLYSSAVSVSESTTLKAIAVKDATESSVSSATYTIKSAVSGYTVDFEDALEAYTDWTFTNAALGGGTITAHDGDGYAVTDGKTTASFQTKDKIALPGTFTCYVSKLTTNTTASTWYIQVSSDGTTWTDVNTQDATTMSAGTWISFTANLSSYSDVYVRLYYSGSTAMRAVDDISIVMRDPDAKPTPTVTIVTTGLTTTDVAGSTNVSAGSLTATVASGETTITSPAVTWSSDDEAVATINASTGAVTLIAAGTTNITATFAGNDDYAEATGTYELTVINTYAKGQINNPYTVAEAIAAIDAGTGTTNVYVSGIVSTVATSVSSGALSYYISDDGTTTTQLEAYKGKGLNNTAFTATTDVEIYDRVTIYGSLTKYNDTYEFSAGNYLVSQTHRATNTITVTNGTAQSIDLSTSTSLTLLATAASGATVVFAVDGTNTTLDASDYTFNAATGVLTITGTTGGYVYITATADGDLDYYDGEETIVITVVSATKIDPTIVVNASESVVYGSTFTVDDSMIEGGEITVTSSNTSVATVSGLVITPMAVGTTTITVATAEDATYNAGSEQFTLTVTAPEGKSTAYAADETTEILDFTTNDAWGLPEGSTNKATASDDFSDGTYTITLEAGTGYYYNTDGYLLMGKTGATLTLPAFSKPVTQIDVVGRTGASTGVMQNIYVGDVAVSTETTGATGTNEYVIDEDYQASGTIYILKVTSNANTQITSIVVHFAADAITATLNANGYASFCSEYPLDFSEAETNGYSAWEVTAASGSTITFDQITGSIKGGQGILLKGTANTTIELTSAASTTTLDDNLLIGTLAPTYITVDQYYGLKGENFKKVNEGTVKSGKAILPASAIASSVKDDMLTFVFNDADGIQTIETVKAEDVKGIFDLSGRRLVQPRKGVNIVNGKKILVK